MGRKGVKIPNETKLNYARLCFERKISKREASRQLGVDCATVREWVYRYREQGELAFLDTGRNNVYSHSLPSFSQNAVLLSPQNQNILWHMTYIVVFLSHPLSFLFSTIIVNNKQLELIFAKIDFRLEVLEFRAIDGARRIDVANLMSCHGLAL